MSRKKGHKLGGSFAPFITHTHKSQAWQILSVGARALFMELQSRYFTAIEGFVFLSSRDGAKLLRTSKNSICRWFNELEHYGFLVKVRDAFQAGTGEGECAHYRLTDRYYHGNPPTRDFEKWDGVVFAPPKREYSEAEKTRLKGLRKNRSPVLRSRTPRPTVKDISGKPNMPGASYGEGHIFGEVKSWHRSNVIRTARRVAEPIDRASTRGRPLLWRLFGK